MERRQTDSVRKPSATLWRAAFSASLIFGIILASDACALTFGIRYSNLNEPLLPAIDRQATQGKFGIYFGGREKNSEMLAGFDYDRYKHQAGDSLLYSRNLIVNFGYRYWLFPREKSEGMKIIPFAGIHYFRSFAKVEADDATMSASEREYLADLTNDQGIWVALGADYYFTPAFSMGCEGGIRYSWVESEALGYKVRITEYKSFVAILIAFHL